MTGSRAGGGTARFVIHPDRSALSVRVDSTLHPTHYRGSLSGHIETGVADATFDLSVPTTGLLELALSKLSSNDARLDRELRERLETERYPTVSATILDARARGGDLYRVQGQLTLHGRTQQLAGDARVSLLGSTLRATGRIVIDIRDFGVKPPKLLLLKVDPYVQVAVDIVAERDGG